MSGLAVSMKGVANLAEDLTHSSKKLPNPSAEATIGGENYLFL